MFMALCTSGNFIRKSFYYLQVSFYRVGMTDISVSISVKKRILFDNELYDGYSAESDHKRHDISSCLVKHLIAIFHDWQNITRNIDICLFYRVGCLMVSNLNFL